MAGVQIIGSPTTVEVARVLACLFEKDVDFDLVRVDAFKGKQRKTDYLRQQPLNESITYEEGKTVRITESRKIIRHICKAYPTRGNKDLLGTGDMEKACVEQWLQTEENHFNPPASSLVFNLAHSLDAQEMEITESKKKLNSVLDMYENRLQKARFLAGDRFSLADLSHLPTIDQLMYTECASLLLSKPKVREWWYAISERPSWKRVLSMQTPAAENEEDNVVHTR